MYTNTYILPLFGMLDGWSTVNGAQTCFLAPADPAQIEGKEEDAGYPIPIDTAREHVVGPLREELSFFHSHHLSFCFVRRECSA